MDLWAVNEFRYAWEHVYILCPQVMVVILTNYDQLELVKIILLFLCIQSSISNCLFLKIFEFYGFDSRGLADMGLNIYIYK